MNMSSNARFGLENLPDRPYLHVGFPGHDKTKNSKSSSFKQSSDENRKSKSPGAMSPTLATLDRMNV